MNAATWLARHIPGLQRQRVHAPEPVQTPAWPEPSLPQARPMLERLKGGRRQDGEALSPRELVRLHEQLKGVNDLRISEVEAGRRALVVMQWYERAKEAERMDLWYMMSELFATDMRKVRAARETWEAAADPAAAARAEMRMRQAMGSPRARLLQRFAVGEGGVRFLVDMRAELLLHTREHPALQLLDAELETIFSTWFDVAFLELRRLSWDSPASLIEKLIKYEAVHDIKSWSDLKNRLDSDRRCYGFFHPRLRDEPLIFVEVAFTTDIAASITPLLDESAAAADLRKASTAIFYSISNTQKGLRGVSFGDSLIKRVVETIHAEFPRIKTFATLSPIPGLRRWLAEHAVQVLDDGDEAVWREAAGQARDTVEPTAVLQWLDRGCREGMSEAMGRYLLRAAARYLSQGMQDGQPMDPVARFHLGNGARIERLNPRADPSPKGWNQSFGMMVNYLYDLKRLDTHRAQFSQGSMAVGPAVAQFLK